jgi:membrane-bound lytic murein transglycosylase D
MGMLVSACTLSEKPQSEGIAAAEASAITRPVGAASETATGAVPVDPRMMIPRGAPAIHPVLSQQHDVSDIKRSLENLVRLQNGGNGRHGRNEDSLWPHLSRSFELDHHLNQRAVQEAVRKLTRNPHWLADAQERLSLYLPYFLSEVQRRNLPAELALLPIIESTLNPAALSPRGALGLWQFMPDTANRFGLSRDWWHDSRMDTVASTRAALDHLETLHAQFGDWLLTMAAYNAGEGTIARTLPAARGRTDTTRFFSLHGLPSETRSYVPRVLALAAILKNPAAYDIELPYVGRDVRFEAITMDKAVDLDLAASVLNVLPAELVALNPGFHRRATPPSGTHNLLVPARTAEFAEARLGAMAADGGLAPVVEYRVRRGDSLSRIARTFNSSIAAIKSLNGLRSDRIAANALLRIPRTVGDGDLWQPTAAYRTAVTQATPRVTSYTVKRGDSLGTIARRFDTTVAVLMQANGLRNHHIRANATLRIPGREVPVKSTPAAASSTQIVSIASTPQRSAADQVQSIRATTAYRVRKGDSLSSIASRHGISIAQLRTLNGLRGDTIRAQQTLRVPVSNEASAVLVAHTADSNYRIRDGDTLWSIARRHSVSREELMRANGLSLDSVLRVGRELRIPQPAPADIAGG